MRGVRVGHAENPERTSGVTTLLFDRAAPTVVDVRGGASCTYDTASLSLESTFGRRWAVFLTGGSLFGLDAARGVRTRILETGGGHRLFNNPNRLVPLTGAALFDLPPKEALIPDYLPLGYESARAASRAPSLGGRVGAGTGATLGKYLGPGHSQPGAVGSSSVDLPRGRRIGAVVALNSVGAVRDPSTGRWVAGARDARGRVQPPPIGPFAAARRRVGRGTTLVAVVTDASADRQTLQRVALGAHAGLSSAVSPVHTATDGDVVFCSSTGEETARVAEGYPGASADLLATAASAAVVAAILDGARRANAARRGP